MFAARPKPQRETVPLERLTFDPRLQMRDLAGALFDEAWVTELGARREAGAEFEPLEAVKEVRKGRQPVYWVFRGFHRGEMWRRAGAASVEVLVYPGTFSDAQFFALSENGAQPKPRTPEDCRRAFDAMIDTPHLLRRVLDAAQDAGGVHRAMTLACGLSKGAVGKYLAARGLSVDRATKKLVSVEVAVSPPPPISPARARQDPEPEPEPEPPKSDKAKARAAAVLESPYGTAEIVLSEVQRELNSVAKKVDELLRGPFRAWLEDAAREQAVPFDRIEVSAKGLVPRVGDSITKVVMTWPTLVSVQAVFGVVAARLADDAARRASDELSRER